MSTPILDSVPVISIRSSRSPDIIDVDLLDEEEITEIQRPLQLRRRDSVIDIEEITELPGLQSDRSLARYISPPPPRPNNDVPPVPPLPTEVHGLASLPRRRRALPQSRPGVVRPISQPFAFEANFGDGQHPASPQPQSSAVTAAPPSHHVPSMGFGGALLAMNAQNSRANESRRSSGRRTGGLQSRVRHIPGFVQATDYLASRLNLIADRLGRLQGELGDFPRPYISSFDEDDEFIPLDIDPMEVLTRRSLHLNSTSATKKSEYQPAFTHPGKMPTDFTHDFCPPNSSLIVDDSTVAGPSSAASSNSSSVDTILVCAQCLDPLVIGSGPSLSATDSRLWGLRCGHILDGKCVEKLFKPDEQILLVSTDGDSHQGLDPSSGSKGKGKAVAVSPVVPDESLVATPVAKGTRRLRSGRAMISTDEPYRKERTPRRRRGKGKGKMRAPMMEGEHEWRCPVPGCSRVHRSVLLDGQWKMEEKMGAIQMYV